MCSYFPLTILTHCSITQLFETLQPGSNGVLINADKISMETLRNGATFLMDLLSNHAFSKHNLKPLKKNNEDNHEAGESEQEGHLSQQDGEEL